MTKDKAHVDDIFCRSKNKCTPVLLKFQNGDLKNANKDSTLYFPAKCESDLKRKHAVVVTSGNVYSGPVSDGSQELVDTYICIRNKTTNKVRILPIDQVKLINHVYEEKKTNQFKLLGKDTAKETIIRTFGGRKDLRYLNMQQRNDVSIDVFRDQLETTVENSELTGPQEQVVTTDTIIESIRPKFNKDATYLASVYSIYDVIPLELIDRLDEEVAALMTTDLDDIPIKSEFLKKSIENLKNGVKSNQTLLKMKMILYMDGLLTLIQTKKKNLKFFELSKITEKVENDIRDRFTSKNGAPGHRSNYTNEKALCYFIVLAFLLSDDFEIDMNTLAAELCMSKVKITKYGQLLNAVFKAKSNKLALKLPSSIKPIKACSGRKSRN